MSRFLRDVSLSFVLGYGFSVGSYGAESLMQKEMDRLRGALRETNARVTDLVKEIKKEKRQRREIREKLKECQLKQCELGSLADTAWTTKAGDSFRLRFDESLALQDTVALDTYTPFEDISLRKRESICKATLFEMIRLRKEQNPCNVNFSVKRVEAIYFDEADPRPIYYKFVGSLTQEAEGASHSTECQLYIKVQGKIFDEALRAEYNVPFFTFLQ
jgi:hypothetical protein